MKLLEATMVISTHYLIQRQTWRAGIWKTKIYFNSLPHAEVDTDINVTGIQITTFQLTTSYRGRPFYNISQDEAYTFQLTTSYRGRRLRHFFQNISIPFQLTTSYRGRLKIGRMKQDPESFQLTTSYRGRRVSGYALVHSRCISTHYLIQRQTKSRKRGEKVFPFQLTTSYRGRPQDMISRSSAISFQLTTSHRGRPFIWKTAIFILNFNSLPHTEVDKSPDAADNWSCTFQLTTSHRGRHVQESNTTIRKAFQLTTSHRGRRFSAYFLATLWKYFNSLPHTEVDRLS